MEVVRLAGTKVAQGPEGFMCPLAAGAAAELRAEMCRAVPERAVQPQSTSFDLRATNGQTGAFACAAWPAGRQYPCTGAGVPRHRHTSMPIATLLPRLSSQPCISETLKAVWQHATADFDAVAFPVAAAEQWQLRSSLKLRCGRRVRSRARPGNGLAALRSMTGVLPRVTTGFLPDAPARLAQPTPAAAQCNITSGQRGTRSHDCRMMTKSCC